MKRNGTQKGRALLVDSEQGVRRTISHFLQLHGMDVVEVDSLQEAKGRLSDQGDFDLMVAELRTPAHAEWHEWKSLVTHAAEISLLIHGTHHDDWIEIRDEIGRTAAFIGQPFTLSDFHWALYQLL